MATLGQANAVHESAREFDSAVDEFDAIHLERAPSQLISVPRIAGAPIAFECVVERIIDMPLNDHVVWGEVRRIHVRDDLYLSGGRIDVGALGAFGRLAAEYTLVDTIFTAPVPEQVIAERAGNRARRLDGHDDGYLPIDTSAWDPSGSVVP